MKLVLGLSSMKFCILSGNLIFVVVFVVSGEAPNFVLGIGFCY